MEIVARNKKAFAEYEVLDKFEVGLVLTGEEIKAVRAHRANLTGAFCRIANNEAWIVNMHISNTADPERSRKLLMHKSELISLGTKLQQKNLTFIPLALYIKKGKAKIEVGLARGKKLYDHREDLKRRDIKREAEREIK